MSTEINEDGSMTSRLLIYGEVELFLIDKHDRIKAHRFATNLVTTAGDGYYAGKAITGIAPASPGAPTAASGMKLGTGVTAAAKSGAGAALGTYITGSNNAFDATYPQLEDLAGDTGFNAVYQTTWAAGDVTNSAITECVLVNDAGTDATSSAANTYSRVTFTAIDKQAGDALIALWKHKFLGA